jgi:hypothetical protein
LRSTFGVWRLAFNVRRSGNGVGGSLSKKQSEATPKALNAKR